MSNWHPFVSFNARVHHNLFQSSFDQAVRCFLETKKWVKPRVVLVQYCTRTTPQAAKNNTMWFWFPAPLLVVYPVNASRSKIMTYGNCKNPTMQFNPSRYSNKFHSPCYLKSPCTQNHQPRAGRDGTWPKTQVILRSPLAPVVDSPWPATVDLPWLVALAALSFAKWRFIRQKIETCTFWGPVKREFLEIMFLMFNDILDIFHTWYLNSFTADHMFWMPKNEGLMPLKIS